MTIEELKKENKELKLKIKELNKQVIDEIKYNREKDEILFQQNRMASMGEMIGNIAHQWRQPLMELSSLFMLLQSKIEFTGTISNEEILQTIEQSDKLTKYMSQTIDDFRNFLKKDKEKENFKISNQISVAVNMINASYKQHNIKLEIIVQKNSQIYGLKNEYSQVLINILTNARDALISRNIKNPKVVLHINEIDKNSIVKISDNAGGIKVKPIEKIFDPFFTQEKSNGTGIGLFMSKIIIENNMNGRLLVENYLDGARFNIIIPLNSK
ncbi:sensor histidine kinase [Poseidonibacter sp.]|uniref:sensor histidine kinase n=1 Tax=Poseidonibacter sp. TaxID=2321188 RepID=UPI003C728B04